MRLDLLDYLESPSDILDYLESPSDILDYLQQSKVGRRKSRRKPPNLSEMIRDATRLSGARSRFSDARARLSNAVLDYLEWVLDYLSSRQIIYGGSRLSRVAKGVARLSTAVKSRS